MYRQRYHLRELLVANRALERFFASVRSYVNDQALLQPKRLLAVSALVRLFARVDLQVVREGLLLGEGLHALEALVSRLLDFLGLSLSR